MKLAVTIAFLLVSIAAQAQEEVLYHFKGSLKSKSTGNSVPFASIFIKSSPLGVASNENGQFELPVPQKYTNDSVVISAIGYKSYISSLKSLMKKDFHNISLEDTTYVLNEVVVVDASAEAVLTKVLDKLNTTFPNDPYEMNCFYRSTLIENGKYAQLLEAEFTMYDKGFNRKRPHAAIDILYRKTRKSGNYIKGAKWDMPFIVPHYIFGYNNYARQLMTMKEHIENDRYNYHLEKQYIDEDLIYVVTADAKNGLKMSIFDTKMYVNSKNYSIIRIDYSLDKDKLAYAGYNMAGYKAECKGFNATFLFKEFDGKMYMYYLRNYNSAAFYNKETNAFLTNIDSKDEAIIQDITPLNGKKRSFRKASTVFIPSMPYEPEFWKKSSIVNEIPFDPKMLKDLQETTSLETQFVNNGTRELRSF